jgi:hypothetical protein
VELALDPAVDAVAGNTEAVTGAWTEGEAIERLLALLGLREFAASVRATRRSARSNR